MKTHIDYIPRDAAVGHGFKAVQIVIGRVQEPATVKPTVLVSYTVGVKHRVRRLLPLGVKTHPDLNIQIEQNHVTDIKIMFASFIYLRMSRMRKLKLNFLDLLICAHPLILWFNKYSLDINFRGFRYL